MKVGDLVRYWHDDGVKVSPPGIIVDFDRDADPVVWFADDCDGPAAYFRSDMEIISENR